MTLIREAIQEAEAYVDELDEPSRTVLDWLRAVRMADHDEAQNSL